MGQIETVALTYTCYHVLQSRQLAGSCSIAQEVQLLSSMLCDDSGGIGVWEGGSRGRGYMYAAAAAKSLLSCPTLCNPTDGSPPGSPVPGILQARTLEWVAISFSNALK